MWYQEHLKAGCEKKAPTVDQKFVNTYTELLIAEQMYGTDSPKARLHRKAILDSTETLLRIFSPLSVAGRVCRD